MRQRLTGVSLTVSTGRWQEVLAMLYAVSVLIMVRSVFRVIEYVMGTDGYLSRHEWPLYVFDGLLMLLTVGIFAWWYPGQLHVLPLATDAELESGQAIEDRRVVGGRK
jgi:hydrogenase/urease accessory protein HupE